MFIVLGCIDVSWEDVDIHEHLCWHFTTEAAVELRWDCVSFALQVYYNDLLLFHVLYLSISHSFHANIKGSVYQSPYWLIHTHTLYISVTWTRSAVAHFYFKPLWPVDFLNCTFVTFWRLSGNLFCPITVPVQWPVRPQSPEMGPEYGCFNTEHLPHRNFLLSFTLIADLCCSKHPK